MTKILFLSHTEENGQLTAAALEALGAASEMSEKLGGELVVGLFGGSVDTAQVGGKTLTVSGDTFAASRYATDAAAAEALVKAAEATIVVAPGTSRMLPDRR